MFKLKFKEIISKLPKPAPVKKTPQKKLAKAGKHNHCRVIMGLGQLFVVVSIAYSTSVIFIGVDGIAAKLALAPQAIFALYTLFKAFSRLYK